LSNLGGTARSSLAPVAGVFLFNKCIVERGEKWPKKLM